MKFGKALEAQAKEIPEALSSVLLNYKALKKKIKAIPAVADEGGCHNEAETDFVNTLSAEVNRFNEFFMDKEEMAVMKLASLSEEVKKLKKSLESGEGQSSRSAMASRLMKSLVDFHGDLVLTLHWSLINYSALSKILKKHDKRTGVMIRQPYLTSCLTQPFNSTNILSRLVKNAESLVEEAGKLARGINMSRAEEPEDAYPLYLSINELKQGGQQQQTSRAKNALDMWENLAKTAITPSTIGVGIKRPADGQPLEAKQPKKA